MATEQDDKNQDAGDDLSKDTNESADSSQDERDDEDVEASDSSSENADENNSDDSEDAVPSEPRNRAERRELAKKVKRGQATAEGEVKERDRNKKAIVRPVVPPLTVTGKSTANVDEVPPWVKRTGDWLAAQRTTVFAVIAAVIVGGVGSTYAVRARADSRAAQAQRLVEASMLVNAEIRASDAPPEGPNRPPRVTQTFVDHAARARAALAASEAAIAVSADLATVPIAKMTRAYVLYDLARYAEAKTLFEAVINENLAGLNGRALEGLGFTLEALNDLPAALRRFEELARLEGDGWRELGTLHQARVLRRQNQINRAKDMLHALVERLERARPDDPTTVTNRAVNDQARSLLHEIAPEDPLGQPQSNPNDTDAIMRMLQQQMGGRLQMRRPGQPRGE